MPTNVVKYADHEVASAYLEEFAASPRGANQRTAEKLGMHPANLAGRLSRMRKSGDYQLPSVRGKRSASYCPHCGAAQWAQKPERAFAANNSGADSPAVTPAVQAGAPGPTMLSSE